MIILNEKQGSVEWIRNRLSRFNASEAAAMFGIDPFMPRDELLKLKALGLEKEHSEWTTNLFAEGHRVEKWALDELSIELGVNVERGLVGYDRETNMGASLDGLIEDGDERAIVEVKLWNDETVKCLHNGDVPDRIMGQVQQQMFVWDIQRCYLIITDGSIERFYQHIVTRDQRWVDRIKSGWVQFAADLNSFDYSGNAIPEVPEPPHQIETIPPLDVQTSITITRSNVVGYLDRVRNAISTVPRTPTTDGDFYLVDRAIKWLRQNERDCETILRLATTNEILDQVRAVAEELRTQRLFFDAIKKTERERIRVKQVRDANEQITRHLELADSRVRNLIEGHTLSILRPPFDVVAAMHGKQIEAAAAAAESVVKNTIQAIEDQAASIMANAKLYNSIDAAYSGLFPDLTTLIREPNYKMFTLAVDVRIANHDRLQALSVECGLVDDCSLTPDCLSPHTDPGASMVSDKPDVICASTIFFRSPDSAPLNKRIILVGRKESLVYQVYGNRTSDGWDFDLRHVWGIRISKKFIPIAWAEIPKFMQK